MCHQHEIRGYYDTISDRLRPYIRESRRQKSHVNFSFHNGFSLYILVYGEEKICGVRAEFVMVTDESIAADDMLKNVLLPLLVVPRNINEIINARLQGYEAIDGRRFEPFIYAIKQQKFLTPMPMRSQNPHT